MQTPSSLVLPSDVARQVEGAALHEVTIGLSGASVYRVVVPGQPTRYLKVAGGAAADELAEESDRLAWLRGRLPVPAVLAFAREDDRASLLLSEVPGLMAYDLSLAADPLPIMRLYAQALRQVHAVPVAGCPFDMRLDQQLARAEQRMRAGLVREDAFDDERLATPVAVLFEQLLRERPTGEDPVFTHGDYCLPNILIDQSRYLVSGYIDCSRAGVGDPYRDLALAVRSIEYNRGDEVEPLLREFWAAYGIEQPDLAKVAYYQLLDEFF